MKQQPSMCFCESHLYGASRVNGACLQDFLRPDSSTTLPCELMPLITAEQTKVGVIQPIDARPKIDRL